MIFNVAEFFVVFLWIFFTYTMQSSGLRFLAHPNVPSCIKQEIHKGVVATGEYEFSDAPGAKTTVKVTDTKGHILHSREDFSDNHGKFSFVADDYDVLELCFTSKYPYGTHGAQREVSLVTKHGSEAKNYDELAKAEKLKPLEVELRRLEDLTEGIVLDFTYMRKREEEMRDTNESTNSRVLYLSIFSMVCLLCLALWQILYLRRYFKAKKLID